MKINAKASLFVGLIAVAVYFKSVEVKAAIGASLLQGFLYANNFFVFSLFANGFAYDQSDDSLLPVLNMGYFNMLQLKLIYVSRFIGRDQFLFDDYVKNILNDIEHRLDAQFKENKWDFETFNELPVPSVDYKDIHSVAIYEKYVKRGIPFIVKQVPSRAVDNWSPDYFAAHYGAHEVAVINTTDVGVLHMNISEYVALQQEGNDNGVLYIRALSDIFDDFPVSFE
jgi:hypothetical protein